MKNKCITHFLFSASSSLKNVDDGINFTREFTVANKVHETNIYILLIVQGKKYKQVRITEIRDGILNNELTFLVSSMTLPVVALVIAGKEYFVVERL